MVKTLSGMIPFIAHVPFSEERGLVTCLLKELRKIHDILRFRGCIVNNGMTMRIHAGEYGGPARGAECRGDKRISHMHSLSRKPVKSGRFQPGYFLHKAHRVITVVVG